MHRYSYITQYTTLTAVKKALKDTISLYTPYANYLGKSRSNNIKRMKYNALTETLAVANQCIDETLCEFMDKINERLGDFDERDSHTVEYYIYRWVLANVEGA